MSLQRNSLFKTSKVKKFTTEDVVKNIISYFSEEELSLFSGKFKDREYSLELKLKDSFKNKYLIPNNWEDVTQIIWDLMWYEWDNLSKNFKSKKPFVGHEIVNFINTIEKLLFTDKKPKGKVLKFLEKIENNSIFSILIKIFKKFF